MIQAAEAIFVRQALVVHEVPHPADCGENAPKALKAQPQNGPYDKTVTNEMENRRQFAGRISKL
jgi:hypothetical protein